MKKDVLIKIRGVSNVDGEDSVIELFTSGSYYKRNGKYYISYKETSDDEPGEVTTTIKVDNPLKVTMLRDSGGTNLVMEKNKRHVCYYNTPMGEMFMGIFAAEVRSSLDERGGDIYMSYAIDFNAAAASQNELAVQVIERDKKMEGTV